MIKQKTSCVGSSGPWWRRIYIGSCSCCTSVGPPWPRDPWPLQLKRPWLLQPQRLPSLQQRRPCVLPWHKSWGDDKASQLLAESDYDPSHHLWASQKYMFKQVPKKAEWEQRGKNKKKNSVHAQRLQWPPFHKGWLGILGVIIPRQAWQVSSSHNVASKTIGPNRPWKGQENTKRSPLCLEEAKVNYFHPVAR